MKLWQRWLISIAVAPVAFLIVGVVVGYILDRATNSEMFGCGTEPRVVTEECP